jgi:hypothetical protein
MLGAITSVLQHLFRFNYEIVEIDATYLYRALISSVLGCLTLNNFISQT